jgi:hypothetical protein
LDEFLLQDMVVRKIMISWREIFGEIRRMSMYIDNIVHETSTYYLDKVLISDGMLKRTNAITETTPVLKYHYFLKDHLGNVRVVFDEDGIIKQVNNYYPFGIVQGIR